MQQEYSGRVNVLGVGSRDSLDELQNFVSAFPVDAFEHLADLEGEVWEAFGVLSQPSYVFVDDGGVVTSVQTGRLGLDGLRQRMDELVST